MKKYCFDIDGTLCSNTEGEYLEAVPYENAINLVNVLYHQGHYIILQTARGFTTKIDWRAITENQLKEWGVLYHELYFGKPSAHVYIDDKAINAYEWLLEKADPCLMLEKKDE